MWKPSEAGDVLATGSEIEVVEEWEGQIITLLCVVTNTMVGRVEGAEDQDEVVFEVYAVEPSGTRLAVHSNSRFEVTRKIHVSLQTNSVAEQ